MRTRTAWRGGLVALACTVAAADARAGEPAAWRCDDGYGHAFVVAHPLDAASGMQQFLNQTV